MGDARQLGELLIEATDLGELRLSPGIERAECLNEARDIGIVEQQGVGLRLDARRRVGVIEDELLRDGGRDFRRIEIEGAERDVEELRVADKLIDGGDAADMALIIGDGLADAGAVPEIGQESADRICATAAETCGYGCRIAARSQLRKGGGLGRGDDFIDAALRERGALRESGEGLGELAIARILGEQRISGIGTLSDDLLNCVGRDGRGIDVEGGEGEIEQ